MQTLTHSRVQTFRTCPKRHWFAYEQMLRPVRTGDALSRGSAFHAALEAYDLTPGTVAEKLAAGVGIIVRNYATVPAFADAYEWVCQGWLVNVMFQLHAARYAAHEYDLIATEQAFEIPLINPETGRASRTFAFAGKIDRIVRLADGQVVIQEYKTTSSDIAPDADYWKRLHIDSQISGYVVAGRYLGHPVTAALYDVTRTPALQPLRATPAENRKYKKDGTLYANQRAENESPEAYGERVAEAMIADQDRYFRFEIIARMEHDINEHQYDMWAMGELIRKCQLDNQWPRNAGACMTYFGRCPYFDPCVAGWQPDHGVPEGFRIADTMHEELSAAPGGS